MYTVPPKKWNQRKAAAPAPYYAAVESSDSEVSDASGQPKKKRKDKTVATLSEPEEEIMLEWLRKHPEFYNRRMMEYKNVQRKETLWREKASDMGKSVEHLKTWYRSMRTRMARLLRKSSKPNEELTERDTWVIENFIFLRKHIEAVHRRPMKSVTQRPAPTASHGPLHPVITVKSEATSGTAETPVSTTSMSPVPRIPELKRPGEQDNGVASTLGDLTNHIMTMQHHLINRLQPPGDQERLAFCEWVRATLVGLDHGVWRRSQKEITDILFRSIAENDAAGEWPSQVPNPTAVWGSANQERPQQQTDHVGFQCSIPQSQVQVPPRPSSAPPATSTGGSPDFSQDVSGFISNLLRNFDTRYNLQDTS